MSIKALFPAGSLIMCCTFALTGCEGDGELFCPPDDGTLSEQLAMTPRADANIEAMALSFDNRTAPFDPNLEHRVVVARQATYDRLLRDVAAARALEPELADVTFFDPFANRTIIFHLDRADWKLFQRGEYDDLDCFLDLYEGEILGPAIDDPNPRTILARFAPGLDLHTIAQQVVFGKVPSIDAAGVGGTAGINGLPRHDGPTICADGSDTTWHYVFMDTDGECTSTPECTHTESYYVTTDAAGNATVQDVWVEGTPGTEPQWITSFRTSDRCGGKYLFTSIF